MVRSMTGFGKAAGELNGETVAVELSSVNHRFLDANLRLPFEWSSLDPVFRELVRKYLSRGKVNISVTRKRSNGASTEFRLNHEVAQQFLDASKELSKMLGSDEAISLEALVQCPGVLSPPESDEDLETVQKVVGDVLEAALKQLDTMRQVEGHNLTQDVLHRIELIRQAVGCVQERLPELNTLYEERLRARLKELLDETGANEDRVALEVALLAEKGDVTEEIVRLNAHLEHACDMLKQDEPVGRKLNFLVQEIQREINTLGSKVRDTSVVREVLDMKSELEKIREQIQNFE